MSTGNLPTLRSSPTPTWPQQVRLARHQQGVRCLHLCVRHQPTRAGSGSTPMASAVTAAPASSSAPTPPTSPSGPAPSWPWRTRSGWPPAWTSTRTSSRRSRPTGPSDRTALAAGGGAQQRPVVRAHPALHRPAGSAVPSAAEAPSLPCCSLIPPPWYYRLHRATEQAACGAGLGVRQRQTPRALCTPRRAWSLWWRRLVLPHS